MSDENGTIATFSRRKTITCLVKGTKKAITCLVKGTKRTVTCLVKGNNIRADAPWELVGKGGNLTKPFTAHAETTELSELPSTLALEMLLHDLSAPVRHIAFFIEQLSASIPQPTPDQSASINRIVENLAIERNLLQDSRLLLSNERHPVVVWERPVRVSALLRELASSFQSDFEKQGVSLRLDLSSDAEVLVDPRALCRVISNLLGNALKATPEHGIIALSARLEGDTMMFSVADTGGGFTRKEAAGLSKGWKDFDQGINPPGIWGGLGLLICHSIVLRYGGKLNLVSHGAGMGATFSFGIKVAKPLPTVQPQDIAVASE